MALKNSLPIVPGSSWSSKLSDQVQELITTFNAEELDALTQMPENAILWANQGTTFAKGSGTIKFPIRLPSTLAYRAFDGTRQYNNLDVAAPAVRVAPWDLSFQWPLFPDEFGNYSMMSQLPDGSIQEFLGAGGLATAVVSAARAYKAQLAATVFYTGYTKYGVTATVKTMPQPGLLLGNDFFSDGVTAPLHYTHPFRSDSGRFANAYPVYGSFDAMFGESLVLMTQRPHPSLPNMTMGLEVTDVIGPTYMRKRFWTKAVQTLHLQSTTVSGNGVAAAPINPFALDTLGKWNEVSFLGASGFSPIRYWIAPQLDNHPFYKNTDGTDKATMTSGPDGGPEDMWINVCSLSGRGSYLHFGGPSETPFSRLYGPGDPRAQSERRVRLETDLDMGVAGGIYHNVNIHFSA